MVWDYPPAAFLRVIALTALGSQVTALQALCDCSVAEAAALVAVGGGCVVAARLALFAAGFAEAVW